MIESLRHKESTTVTSSSSGSGPRYRGDEIPSVSEYAHHNEDAERIWYEENKYDMFYAGEPMDDDPYDDYDDRRGEEEDE